jgi:hypothetical protein
MPGNIVALDIHLPELTDAQFDLLVRGKLAPVTRMFGFDGQRVYSPTQAFSCVAYLGPKMWCAIEVKPGEIAARKDAPLLKRNWETI